MLCYSQTQVQVLLLPDISPTLCNANWACLKLFSQQQMRTDENGKKNERKETAQKGRQENIEEGKEREGGMKNT